MGYALSEESFLKDVSDHAMTIIRDDGVNRHIRFRRPNTICYSFDLITWPGVLCYTGDMGTYVFSRLEDMFVFFRTDRKHTNEGKQLFINPGYWSEKLLAVDGGRSGGSVLEFDEVKFDKVVISQLVEWIREHRGTTSKEDRRELWEAVVSEVINADGDTGGMRKQIAGHDFFHTVNYKHDFSFTDLWDYSVQQYTHHFIWCCYALAWGIKVYDDRKTDTEEAA